MACLFDSCEKEIQLNLEKYKKCEGVLLQLLHAIQQVQSLPPAENPEELLKSIVDKVLSSRDEVQIPADLPDTEKFEEISVSAADIVDKEDDDDDNDDDEDDDDQHVKCVGPYLDKLTHLSEVCANIEEEKNEVDDDSIIVTPIVITDERKVSQGEKTEDDAEVSIPTEQTPIEDINDLTKEGDPPKKLSIADNALKNDELSLLWLGGPKVGVKYQIEVTSPLNPDGTFWAAHVECGHIQDKLEHLSDLLRSSTKADRSLWKVDKLDEMVCVKSSENGGLWMRAVVIKEINDGSVKLLFIDVGRSEECQRSRLSKVPNALADIPYMAFYCALFEEQVKIPYEGRWRWSDICKKKILNFTCEKFIERNNKRLLVGKFETILDVPVINIVAEIKNYLKPGCLTSGEQEGDSIVSRDIRTRNVTQTNNLTSVTEIIRSDPAQGNLKDANEKSGKSHGSNSSLSSGVSSPDQRNQKKANLPPVLIPSRGESCYSSDDKLSWGDSKTPTVADLEEIFNETIRFTPEESESYGQETSIFNFDENSDKTPIADNSYDVLQENSCEELTCNSNNENTDRVSLSTSVENVENSLTVQQNQCPQSSVTVSPELPIAQVNQNEVIGQHSSTASQVYQLRQLQYQWQQLQNETGNFQNSNTVDVFQKPILNLNQQMYESAPPTVPFAPPTVPFAPPTVPFAPNLQPAQIPHQRLSQCYERTNHHPFHYHQNLRHPVSMEPSNAVLGPDLDRSLGSAISGTRGYPNHLGKKDGCFSSFQHGTSHNMLGYHPQEYQNTSQYPSNPNSYAEKDMEQRKYFDVMQQRPGFPRKSMPNLHEQPLFTYPHLEHNDLNTMIPIGLLKKMEDHVSSDMGCISAKGDRRDTSSPSSNIENTYIPNKGFTELPSSERVIKGCTELLTGTPIAEVKDYTTSKCNTVPPEIFSAHDNECQKMFNKDCFIPTHNPELSGFQGGSSTECGNNSGQYKNTFSSPIEAEYPMGPRLMGYKNIRRKSREYKRDTSQLNSQSPYSVAKQHCSTNVSSNAVSNNTHVSSNKPPALYRDRFINSHANRNSYGEERFSNRSASGEELKKFEEVTLERMQIETRNEWITREIYNLTHPYFEHKKARFFTVIIKEYKGWYGHVLMKALQYKSYWLRESYDVDVFRKEWDCNDGPLFLLVKHRPANEAEKWKNGGIFQVITKIRRLPDDKYLGNMGCQIKFVSTAIMDEDPFDLDIRSDKTTREVPGDMARAYIRNLITKLQEGRCQNLFKLPQYTSKYYKELNSNQININEQLTDQSVNSKSTKVGLPGEDWDLALEEIKGFSKNEFGSDDETDQRDLNLEMDVYGLNQEDIK